MNLRGFFHLGVVYILWGSTYLGIRIAVQEGSGFPPMIMSATRVFIGSLILYCLARFVKKQKFQLTQKDWINMARTPTSVHKGYGYMNWFLNSNRDGSKNHFLHPNMGSHH